MIYIVDGHNLIPKIAGLSLADADDEMRLVEMLQVFSRVRRKKVEVYFDAAPPGQVGSRLHGSIRAHYVRKGYTADDAIRDRLDKMGAEAREVLVISSDHRVQGEARAHHAAFLDAELFARELSVSPHSPIPAKAPPAPPKKETPAQPGTKAQPRLTPDELAEWMDLFKGKKKE